MRNFKAVFALALAFGAGCVTKEVVVPAVRANSNTEPVAARPATRWEYLCIDGWGGVARSSNQLGKEGWEMAAGAGTSDHMMWCFKRAIP
jgi:hypothetical protein